MQRVCVSLKLKCDAWQPKSETVTRTHAQLHKPSYFHAKQRWSKTERRACWNARAGGGGNRWAWKRNVTVVKRFCPCKCGHTTQGRVSGRPTQGQERTRTHRLLKRPWERGPPTAPRLELILCRDEYHPMAVYTRRKPNMSLYLKI